MTVDESAVVVEEPVFSGSLRREGWVDKEQLVERIATLLAAVGNTRGGDTA